MFKLFKRNKEEQGDKAQVKLSRPVEILQEVGQHLVTVSKLDPDFVWGLKCVTKTSEQGGKRLDFRVFNAQSAGQAGVTVKNFHSLDDQPNLVLYWGWVDRKTRDLEVNDRQKLDKAV